MALHSRSLMSSAARSSHSVVSIGASDPSSPKDLSLPHQEPDRTHALSFYVTCVLMSSHSCAVVLWVRAVYSDCSLLLPTAQIRAGTLVVRSTSLRQKSSNATPHQDAGLSIIRHTVVNLGPSTPISIVTIRRMSHHHASALGTSPGHHKLPSLPAVHCTDHAFSSVSRYCPWNLHCKTSRNDHPTDSQCVLAIGQHRVSGNVTLHAQPQR